MSNGKMCRDFLFSTCYRQQCKYKHKLVPCVRFAANGECPYMQECKYAHVSMSTLNNFEKNGVMHPSLAYEKRRIYEASEKKAVPWCDLRTECYRPGCTFSHDFTKPPPVMVCKSCKSIFLKNSTIVFYDCGHIFCSTCTPNYGSTFCAFCCCQANAHVVIFEDIPQEVTVPGLQRKPLFKLNSNKTS